MFIMTLTLMFTQITTHLENFQNIRTTATTEVGKPSIKNSS